MRYLSVCSGIEAATVAWHPLGWEAAAFSEIEAFPRAVLAHHYPDTPLHGDFTTIGADDYGPIDLLVGGTPCQSFSIAGLRGGLADERGNLALEYLRLADRKRPRWLVWENVPGVLSSEGGRDFGTFLGALGELGYGFAYRVLDAQHFGVPQRRRRVFVVGYLGDWRRPAAVLFERHSLSGHPTPRRQAGQGTAGRTAPCLNAAFGSKLGLDNQHIDSGAGLFIAHSLRVEGFDASEDGTGRGTPLVPCFAANDYSTGAYEEVEIAGPLTTGTDPAGGENQSARLTSAVRRLTPEECEKLQGFSPGYTRIPWRGKSADLCPDGPRYKALGNSFAVPVVRWLGQRIQLVDSLPMEALRAA